MTYTDKGTKPKWVEGGNSLKQDEARRMANKLDLDQHTSATWKVAQESAYKEIEAVFIKQVPPHAFDLEDGVWIKRLLNKAFKNNKHE